MLIVIFAQYIEIRETSAARERQRTLQAAAERELLAAERERQLAAVSAERRAVERSQADLEAEREEIEQRERELREALEHALEQQQQVGDIVSELFRVPDELIQELLQQRDSDAGARSAAEIESLKQAFREFGQLRGVAAVKHLLTYEELRKRCDIWEIYITAEGIAIFDAGDASKQFRFREADADSGGPRTRAEIRAEDETAAQKFADRIFDFYKTLPQSKSVVIMLLSYSKTTSYNWRRPAILGLSKAADRMRADSSGRTRFEYALLGTVDPPSPETRPQ
jgi:hypothetical protein